jgi:hypothetical protein
MSKKDDLTLNKSDRPSSADSLDSYIFLNKRSPSPFDINRHSPNFSYNHTPEPFEFSKNLNQSKRNGDLAMVHLVMNK